MNVPTIVAFIHLALPPSVSSLFLSFPFFFQTIHKMNSKKKTLSRFSLFLSLAFSLSLFALSFPSEHVFQDANLCDCYKMISNFVVEVTERLKLYKHHLLFCCLKMVYILIVLMIIITRILISPFHSSLLSDRC